jgi:hypothetical protein
MVLNEKDKQFIKSNWLNYVKKQRLVFSDFPFLIVNVNDFLAIKWQIYEGQIYEFFRKIIIIKCD